MRDQQNGTPRVRIQGQDYEVPDLTQLPDRAFREAWTTDGSVITIDPIRKSVILTKRINEECERRILARYPLYRQINQAQAGGAEAGVMRAWIDAMRTRANALQSEGVEAYADDRLWPDVPSDAPLLSLEERVLDLETRLDNLLTLIAALRKDNDAPR